MGLGEKRNSRKGPFQSCGRLEDEVVTPREVSSFMGEYGLELVAI
jgi:hypothetical protein